LSYFCMVVAFAIWFIRAKFSLSARIAEHQTG